MAENAVAFNYERDKRRTNYTENIFKVHETRKQKMV